MTPMRLTELLSEWRAYMHSPDNKSGYPDKAKGMIGGGASSADAFSHMCDQMDLDVSKIIDALIDGLKPVERKQAIYARWLQTKPPTGYIHHLNSAIDDLIKKLEQKGII